MQGKIISFVGRGSLSGKTAVMEQVIEEFVRRGLRVTAVKHGIHMAKLDKEGKDTYRFAQKGAGRVIMFSDEALLMYEYSKPSPGYVMQLAGQDADIVLIEGFKDGPFPKIEVFNAQYYPTPLCVEHPHPDFMAIVSSIPLTLDIPCFGFENIMAVCDLIQKKTAV